MCLDTAFRNKHFQKNDVHKKTQNPAKWWKKFHFSTIKLNNISQYHQNIPKITYNMPLNRWYVTIHTYKLYVTIKQVIAKDITFCFCHPYSNLNKWQVTVIN